MPGVETSQLRRSLQSMTLGAIRASKEAEAQAAIDQLAEIDLQFQLPIQGTAYAAARWGSVQLAFDTPFYDAVDQRDSPYIEPIFTYGVILNRGHVFITCAIEAWEGDQINGIKGATVAVGACNPGGRSQKFSGHIHLNFQGYGARAMDPDMESGNPLSPARG